ncbi:hypothetical protein [Nocardioides sp.]|uniref:hypothetical protein n=1 Tax=Nocardioides sp. TaxID=35761 RepID=UPI0035B17E01
MTRLKRIPVSAVPVVAVLVGFVAALAGLYLVADLVHPGAGAGVTLLVGGIVAIVAGLVVDLD